MGVSVYSFASAVIFFNIGLLVISILRRNTNFLVRNSTFALILLFFLTIMRLFIPIDLVHATVIQSKHLLPFVEKILDISIYKTISISRVIQAVWFIGTTTIVIMEFYNFRKVMKEIRSCKAIYSFQLTRVLKYEISNIPFEVTVSQNIDVPRVTGLVKAHIFIPPLDVSDSELTLILLHEIEHIKGKDIYIKIFYILIKALFWWNPIVHAFQHEVENMLELRCDMAVTKNMDYEQRVFYLDTVLKVMKQVKLLYAKTSYYSSNLIKYEKNGITKQRFKVILNRTKTVSAFTEIKCAIIISTMFICSYFVIVQPIYLPIAKDIEGNISICEDNAYIVIYSDKKMELFVNGEAYSSITEQELKDVPYNELNKIRKEKRE